MSNWIRLRRTRTLRLLITLMICATTIVSLPVGFRLLQGLQNLRSVPHDNVQWTLSQGEVDHLRYWNSLLEARASGDLSDLRTRFDILYSRVKTLDEGQVFEGLRAAPEARATIDRLKAFLDRTAPVIDLDDSGLLPRLDTLVDEAERVFPEMRTLALQGIEVFALESDSQRKALEHLLILAFCGAVALVLLLFALLTLTVREHRIAERRRREITRNQARLNSVIRASLDAILVIDRDGHVLEFNEAAEKMFGYRRADVLGEKIAELVVPEHRRSAHRARLSRLFAEGNRLIDQERDETMAVRGDGTEFPIELSVRTVQTETETSIVAFVRDITRQHAAARAIEDARDCALRADEAKSRFVAMMSHEMRTPLNGLVGMLDLMRENTVDAAQRGRLDIAIGSGEILRRHVDDVLDIAQLESSRMELADVSVDLNVIAGQVLDLTLVEAERKGIGLDLASRGEPPLVRTDPHRMRQVLMNVVGNAVKFTERGAVSVEIATQPAENGDLAVEIVVADTGPGIPEDQRSRIFDDFVTLQNGYDRAVSGSGLGLAITRRILEAMGGTISVETSRGGGSLFRVALTCPRGEPAAAPPPMVERAGPAPRSRSVLIVEDNEINRQVARYMVENAGHTVTEAGNGAEGVRLAAAHRFDLVLMDISMPGMDGIAATRAIRALPPPHGTVRIVALTAHALPAERARFAEAGMQDCLIKPIRLAAVTALLAGDTGPAAGMPPSVGEDDAARREDLVDVDTVADIATSMPGGALEGLVDRIVDELATVLPRLDTACGSGEAGTLAELAHKLTGSLGLLGACALTDALADLETAAKSGAAPERLEERLARVHRTSEATIPILREMAGGT